MIYWKNNIIFTSSSEKPLQKARSWFNGMANNICSIKPILPLTWQIELNTKLDCSAKHFSSSPPWTSRNSGKQELGLGPSVSETQHCIYTTLSVFFSLQITSTRQCGVYISIIEMSQLHTKPLQCLPQEEAPLRLMKMLILHNRCHRSSRRAVGKKWTLKQVGSHSASTLKSERAAWWGLMRLRWKQGLWKHK